MKKGILLIAIGHFNYGKMAATLAATIKSTGSTLPVHLAYTDSAVTGLTDEEMKLFNSAAIVPEKYYKKAKIRTKVFMYDLSPFEETLYLDVDLLWFNRAPELLMNEFKDIVLTYSTYSNLGAARVPDIWANLNEVRSAYKLTDEKIYPVQSELIYFRKCDEVKAFFKTAKQIYDNLQVKATVFAGGIPDELPFMISSSINKLYPHVDNFRPIYWKNTRNTGRQAFELYKDFYGMSMAGNSNSKTMIEMYNLLAAAAYYNMKKSRPYKWIVKRSFLPERSTL